MMDFLTTITFGWAATVLLLLVIVGILAWRILKLERRHDDVSRALGYTNAIFVQGTDPGAALNEGDLWIDTSRGNLLLTWGWTGEDQGDWTPHRFGGSALAADSVGAYQVAPNSLNGMHLAAGSITAASGVLANGSVGTAQLADLAVTNAKVAMLDAAKVTTGKLDPNRLL